MRNSLVCRERKKKRSLDVIFGPVLRIMIDDTREQLWSGAMRDGRCGDAVAYGRLLREVAELLRKVIRARMARLGLGVDETEDVVQEVLMGIHNKRHTWDANRPFLPWLYAVTRYKVADAARRLRREAHYIRDISEDEWASLFEVTEEDEMERGTIDLEGHLSRLPAGQREVVRAWALEGTSVRATAEKLGTSEGAVRVTLHRALKRLAAAAGLRGDRPPGAQT